MPPQSRSGALKKLSDAASQGEWGVFDDRGTLEIGHAERLGERPCIVGWSGFDSCDKHLPERRANATFIVALVNAYREGLLAPRSEKQAPITDNDRRWRFLEHGCQWVSFTPIGGDTRSFDPRIVSGYAGHLEDMRATVDREAAKQVAALLEGAERLKRSLK